MADGEGAPASVKLKIHYTFDAEHKDGCLSKPSRSYQIQTACLDEGTEVGVIELRTCLEALLESSPEITSSPENDYTVYAYDYSEPNTPLVGQGMLSKVIAGLGNSSEAMVTGKITQNPLAKIKKNAEPFLEVKLRLTPIAGVMQRGRSGSMSSVSEGMQAQWSSFSQVAPVALDRPQSPADVSRLGNIQRMVNEGGLRRENSFNNAFPSSTASRPTSRPGTPTNNQQNYQLPPQPGSQHSRQGSLVYQPGTEARHARQDSFSGYYSAEEHFEEPAKKRARLTTVQQARKTDFNIEQQPNSLQRVAIGASSLRLHQPMPLNPSAALQRGLSVPEGVRPPTPVPKKGRVVGKLRGRPRKNQGADSAEPSSPITQQMVLPPYPPSNMSSPEETRDRLPNASAHSTPADITSSPPPMPEHGMGVPATSPDLPKIVQPQAESHLDSGYFSEKLGGGQIRQDDFFGDFQHPNFDGAHFAEWLNAPLALPLEDVQASGETNAENHYTPVFDEESNFEGPTPQPEAPLNAALIPQSEMNQPLQQIPAPVLHQPRGGQVVIKADNAFQKPLPPVPPQPVAYDKNGRPVPALAPRPSNDPPAALAPRPPPAVTRGAKFQRSQSVLPPVPASDPGTRSFQRSSTWAPDMNDAIMSDAAGTEDGKKPRRKRIGKEQTKARLESAIANGNVPPYCHNCGAIETPAWRRAFVKTFTCSIDAVETSLEKGQLCFKQITKTNKAGQVTEWKGWKVEIMAGQGDDDGWEQIQLCNPCGLWFHKTKTPRPPEKWQKKDPQPRRKRKRPPKPPKSRTNPPRAAAGNLPSDAQEPPSEDSSPADTTMEDGEDDDDNIDATTVNDDGDIEEDSQELELPAMPKGIMSANPGRRTVMFAADNAREVQSSPILGGNPAEPIEVDLTPRSKPLRRVLFPSPDVVRTTRKVSGPLVEKANETLLPSFVRRSPRLNKIRDIFAEAGVRSAIGVEDAADEQGKENVTPQGNHDDLNDLFGGELDETTMAPATPTPKRRSERILSRTGRTPSREFGAEISGKTQMSPCATKTPKRDLLSSLFMDTVNRNLPIEFMTPNTRRLRDACLNKTPKTPHSKKSQKSFDLNFPDLPSLNDSSPRFHEDAQNPFSELPTEQIYPTDGVMPSSPPIINHNTHSTWNDDDDFMHIDMNLTFGSGIDEDDPTWDFLKSPGSASKYKKTKKQQSTENGLLGVEEPSRGSEVRRSPRRNG